MELLANVAVVGVLLGVANVLFAVANLIAKSK